MPNLKNAKKAVRQAEARYILNKRAKDRIHRWELKTAALVADKKKDDAVKSLSFLTKLLDKATKDNIVSFNRVQRVKSRMQKLVNGIAL